MNRQPLLVHFVFHPKSVSARALAQRVHQELNGDVIVPGLRVPTVFCPPAAGPSHTPLRFDLAERNFVVLLADDEVVVDDHWKLYFAETYQRCAELEAGRCLPIQLTEHAWPLHDSFNEIAFSKAWLQNEGADRDAFVVRGVVVGLCRYLANLEEFAGPAPAAPIMLFLSHAKGDLKKEPRVTEKLIACLKSDQPIEAWVDSGDIEAGSKFSNAIRDGVAKTSLLAVLTDSYATREWCREEILLAKEHQRPVVVVDALSTYEIRSFPYLGNVPHIRWADDPQKGIDLLLKESLRTLHARAVLASRKAASDTVFTRPPELATLVGLPPETTVLYPDPPVGGGETARLSKTKISFQTPMQRLAAHQPLKGQGIALSMSESTDIAEQGLDTLHLDGAMLELSQYLLIKGARLAYGGHLGAEGHTQKLFELVRTHRSLEGLQPFERIVNHRGWPLPRLTTADRAKIDKESQVVELPRPGDVDESLDPDLLAEPKFFPAKKSAAHRFAWARGMTEMRRYQADRQQSGVVARVAMGGPYGPTMQRLEDNSYAKNWYMGRIPGLLEEIYYSALAGQPVFLIGAFGGATRLVIDILHGKERPEATWEFQKEAPHAVEMRELYRSRGVEWIDYPEIVELLRSKGVAGINHLLDPAASEELFVTVDPYRMVELILEGLQRLRT